MGEGPSHMARLSFGGVGKGRNVLSHSPPIAPGVGGKTGPDVMSVEEPALLLTIRNTWENRPCNSYPDNIVKLVMLAEEQGILTPRLPCGSMGERMMTPSPPAPASGERARESFRAQEQEY